MPLPIRGQRHRRSSNCGGRNGLRLSSVKKDRIKLEEEKGVLTCMVMEFLILEEPGQAVAHGSLCGRVLIAACSRGRIYSPYG